MSQLVLCSIIHENIQIIPFYVSAAWSMCSFCLSVVRLHVCTVSVSVYLHILWCISVVIAVQSPDNDGETERFQNCLSTSSSLFRGRWRYSYRWRLYGIPVEVALISICLPTWLHDAESEAPRTLINVRDMSSVIIHDYDSTSDSSASKIRCASFKRNKSNQL